MDESQCPPKTIQEVGKDCPVVTVINPAYVEWLEKRNQALVSNNAALRLQLSILRDSEVRRRKWELDHVPYGDDEHDR